LPQPGNVVCRVSPKAVLVEHANAAARSKKQSRSLLMVNVAAWTATRLTAKFAGEVDASALPKVFETLGDPVGWERRALSLPRMWLDDRIREGCDTYE